MEAELERAKKVATDSQAEFDKCSESMYYKQTTWEKSLGMALDKMNSRFAAFFQSFNCEGKISLMKTETFATYGVAVEVAYRSGEGMSLLSDGRNSGGERSVATMCYLLALQSHASASFRVIDEINQGMDEQNERRMFNLVAAPPATDREPAALDSETGLVQISKQYFVISPKLLPGLTYPDSVTVHCIMNGGLGSKAPEERAGK